MSRGFSALVLASLAVCIVATEARDQLSPLQWGKRVNRALGLRGHKNHAASILSGSSKRAELELDVPIESTIERALEDAGVASNRAMVISGGFHQAGIARKLEETKTADEQSAGVAQVVTASPNPLADAPVQSSLTASPNPLAGATAEFHPTASPNPLAEDSAPNGPTASPNVLAGNVIVDEDNGAPVASMATPVLATVSAPVTASTGTLVAIPNPKSLDSLFGSARAAPTASVESAVAPTSLALAAVAPAAVAVAPVAVAPVPAPVVTPVAPPPPVVQAGAAQPVAQQLVAQPPQASQGKSPTLPPGAPVVPPLAAVSLTKPVVNKVLKLGLKGMAVTGGEFTLKVMNQMTEQLRHSPGADVVQYLDELGGLQRGPIGARNTFWISLVRNPCDWYVQLWASCQSTDRQALNNQYGGAFFSAGNQDQLKFENWLNWALGDHDNILPDSNGLMSLRYEDTVVAGKPVDWIYNRQHMQDYNGQLLNAYALSRNDDPVVETDLRNFSPKSKVDCWITVEHYVESLRNCLSQYEAMAHVELNWEPFDLLIDKPGKTTGDNIVERDQCEAYYTSELAEKVQHRDRHLFEVFGYDTCCGAPTRPIK